MTNTSTSTADASPSMSFGADPRPALTWALALAGRTLAALGPDQLDLPTPCPEYTVRDLRSHLVAVARRVVLIGRGGDPLSLPALASDVADGQWSAEWDNAVGDIDDIWSEPDVLNRPMRLPFGTLPGGPATVVYVTEFTLHTWDLAVATGQQPSWDPEVLAFLVAVMHRTVPADVRGGPVPFGPVVDVAADAPDIDRLVAWYGRAPELLRRAGDDG